MEVSSVTAVLFTSPKPRRRAMLEGRGGDKFREIELKEDHSWNPVFSALWKEEEAISQFGAVL